MKYIFSLLFIVALYDISAQSIIGGENAGQGEYPWMASLVTIDSSSGELDKGCGGSLIDPNWVLTAGHCVEYLPSDISNLRIVINSLTANITPLPLGGELIEVEEIFIHEDYDDFNFSFGNDLALIRLKEPAIAEPIELATFSDSIYYQHHAPAKVLGWGLMDTLTFEPSDSLLVAQPVFIDIDTCSQLYTNSRFASAVADNLDNLICSGYYEDIAPVGAASGDSGGPLFYENNGEYKQVGIVSGGARLYTTLEFPGVFVFIPNYLDWIYETISNYEEPTSVSDDHKEHLQYYISDENYVHISSLDPSDNYSFEIVDLSGRTSIDNEKCKGINVKSISLNNLNSGMYVLLIHNMSEGTFYNFKLLVN